jgi:hypothetical protein
MQRQDIASFLGMTLETVSRSFSALQNGEQGLIAGARPRPRIRLLGPPASPAAALCGMGSSRTGDVPLGTYSRQERGRRS